MLPSVENGGRMRNGVWGTGDLRRGVIVKKGEKRWRNIEEEEKWKWG